MNDNTLYELTVDQTHMNIIITALSNFMCSNYNAIDLEVVDVARAMEEIKVASDIQLVLKHQLGKTRHTPKQTAQHTGLVWCKEINLDEYCDEEPFEPFNDDNLQTNGVVRSLSSVTKWIEECSDEDFMKHYPENNLQDLPLYQKSDEQRQKDLNDSVEYAKHCLDTFLKNQPKYDTEGGILSKAWDNVKERHWDTLKQMGNK